LVAALGCGDTIGSLERMLMANIPRGSKVVLVEDLEIAMGDKVKRYKKGSRFIYVGPWPGLAGTSELAGDGDTLLVEVPDSVFKLLES